MGEDAAMSELAYPGSRPPKPLPNGPAPLRSPHPDATTAPGYHRVEVKGTYWDCPCRCERLNGEWLATRGGRPLADRLQYVPKEAEPASGRDAPAPPWAEVVHRQRVAVYKEPTDAERFAAYLAKLTPEERIAHDARNEKSMAERRARKEAATIAKQSAVKSAPAAGGFARFTVDPEAKPLPPLTPPFPKRNS